MINIKVKKLEQEVSYLQQEEQKIIEEDSSMNRRDMKVVKTDMPERIQDGEREFATSEELV